MKYLVPALTEYHDKKPSGFTRSLESTWSTHEKSFWSIKLVGQNLYLNCAWKFYMTCKSHWKIESKGKKNGIKRKDFQRQNKLAFETNELHFHKVDQRKSITNQRPVNEVSNSRTLGKQLYKLLYSNLYHTSNLTRKHKKVKHFYI